ncbi:MAG: carboxymuconolactone decarboxylase family protein [Trueperaceae bacterium]|nr:MAG: carboxymuconolactone decarboxylase family protein [Trueperaceae bacterium]
MLELPIHKIETAPPASRPVLEKLVEMRGSVNNMFAVLAASPAVLKGYMALNNEFFQHGTLSMAEKVAVLLTASRENECSYCVPIYTSRAEQIGLDAAVVKALRNGETVEDERLATLVDFTASLVRSRGKVEPYQVEAFLSAGYTEAQVLEVLAALALKTVTNYLTQFTAIPLDDSLLEFAWEPSGG